MMSRQLPLIALSVLWILTAVQATAGNTLPGTPHLPTGTPPVFDTPEVLYKGDLIPEMGIGCSNPTGTSGGPNDIAEKVTATMLMTPFAASSLFYNIYTQVSPNIAALSFVLWRNGPTPGAEFYRQAGLPFAQGSHTAAIHYPMIDSRTFCFGMNQPQTNVGMRWGIDTDHNSDSSFIRAPGCGATSFVTLASLGYPSEWCMALSCMEVCPVELTTWGALKGGYK